MSQFYNFNLQSNQIMYHINHKNAVSMFLLTQMPLNLKTNEEFKHVQPTWFTNHFKCD